MGRAYRGILFDLFGTLITFDASRLPELELNGRRIRSTVPGLGPALDRWLPGETPASLATALRAASEELACERAETHVERPSRERFRRALTRLGCPDAVLPEAAIELSRMHMRLIVAATVLPPAHAALLASLHGRWRLALVSNFDDTGTAWEILVRHGIAPHLDCVVVSESLGLRKPHPVPLRAGLAGLELDPGEALVVGDTFAEDVLGAHAAGVDAAWIDAGETGVPTGPPPRYVIRALPELADLLR